MQSQIINQIRKYYDDVSEEWITKFASKVYTFCKFFFTTGKINHCSNNEKEKWSHLVDENMHSCGNIIQLGHSHTHSDTS